VIQFGQMLFSAVVMAWCDWRLFLVSWRWRRFLDDQPAFPGETQSIIPARPSESFSA